MKENTTDCLQCFQKDKDAARIRDIALNPRLSTSARLLGVVIATSIQAKQRELSFKQLERLSGLSRNTIRSSRNELNDHARLVWDVVAAGGNHTICSYKFT